MNRRDWLISTLSMATLPEILAAQEHAHHAVQSIQPPAFSYLDKKAAADIEALTGEIIPSGDSPGAREAGVVYFIDRALHTFDQAQQGLYRSGLETHGSAAEITVPALSKHFGTHFRATRGVAPFDRTHGLFSASSRSHGLRIPE